MESIQKWQEKYEEIKISLLVTTAAHHTQLNTCCKTTLKEPDIFTFGMKELGDPLVKSPPEKEMFPYI